MVKIDSSVDWADLEKGELYVRDRKLLNLISDCDFVEMVFHTWIHKRPSQKEKRMLNAILASFCGGWSIIPPVILSARLAATTKAPIAQCLAAGFSASGPSHTSAIEEVMRLYVKTKPGDIPDVLNRALKMGERIPGFGHPVLKKDPRPEKMRQLADKYGVVGENVEKFDYIEKELREKKGIFGNIDGINGAILVDLGFRNPAFGPAFFLMGRSVSITAHIIEEYGREPFSALNLVYPGFERINYTYRDSLEV